MMSTLPPKLARDPELRVASVVAVGARIDGRFRVESVVGRGGMGLVVAARDESTSDRVAVKLLLPRYAESPSFARRALREARAAAMLKSEHATRVLHVGDLDSGLPYIVMELLDGLDFERLLSQRGALSVGEVATYLVQACDAIVEAHARGIVHRDLKPSNLFLTHRADGSPLVKLMDFGISKVDKTEPDATLTTTQDSPGTPRYMSPEQLLSARSVDGRTDVWALGVIAFRMLAGRHPFDGETSAAVHIAIASHPAPSLADVRPDTPAPIVQLIGRCLQKSPAARLQTAGAFAAALLPFADAETQQRYAHLSRISGQTIPAVAVPILSVPSRGHRHAGPRAAGRGLAAVLAVAAGVVAAVTLAIRHRGPDETTAAPPVTTAAPVAASFTPASNVPENPTAIEPAPVRASVPTAVASSPPSAAPPAPRPKAVSRPRPAPAPAARDPYADRR